MTDDFTTGEFEDVEVLAANDGPEAPAAADSRTQPDDARVGELVIDRDERERARSLLHKRAGIALFPVKHEKLLRRLRQRMHHAGVKNFGEYLDRIEDGDAIEFESFVSLLLNGDSGFFREPQQFEMLGQRFRELGRARPIRVWSIGAATGEEAYSIAITAIEVFQNWAPPVTVVATDVDHSSLEIARGGVFPAERLSSMEAASVQRYFFRGVGEYKDSYRVRPELQALIRWRHSDVTDPSWPVRGPFDAIFCRNVLGYLETDAQERVADRLAGSLRVGGLVFAGNAETQALRRTGLRPRGGAVYQLASKRR